MEPGNDGTYPPLNTLKRVTEDLWIVDGPEIRFCMPWPKLPFPTRMTLVRLEGGLFVHSPTALTPALQDEVAAIGRPRWIVGPNRIHYWWIPEWHRAFPDAEVYLAPRIREQAGGHIDFEGPELVRGPYPWEREIATLPIAGRYMTEVEFFHRASRTLILTDLIESFEAHKLPFLMRMLTWLGGVQHPGGMPRDMRLTYPKPTLKAAVETMIGWNPERVIVAHGRWFERAGAEELRRAFDWLLR